MNYYSSRKTAIELDTRRIILTTSIILSILIVNFFFRFDLDFRSWTLGIGIVTLLTVVIDVFVIRHFTGSVISVLSVFVVLSYVFSLGQLFINAFFPNYTYRYGSYIGNDDAYVRDCVLFSYTINQTVFSFAILEKPFRKVTKWVTGSFRTENEQLRICRLVGYIITIIFLPIWIYATYRSYASTALLGGYARVASTSGILESLGFFHLIGFCLILLSYKYDYTKMKTVLLVEIIVCVLYMLTGGRQFSVIAICVLIITFYRSGNKIRPRTTIIILILGYVFLQFITTISKIRLNNALDLDIILKNMFSSENNVFLLVLEEFGGTVNSILKPMRQIHGGEFGNGITYLKSLITLGPNINDTTRTIYRESLFINFLSNNKTMGGSFIGELYYNFGYMAYLFAPLIGKLIGKISQSSNALLENGKYIEYGYLVMFIFSMFRWIRGYFVEMVRQPIWGILLIWLLLRIIGWKKK